MSYSYSTKHYLHNFYTVHRYSHNNKESIIIIHDNSSSNISLTTIIADMRIIQVKSIKFGTTIQ